MSKQINQTEDREQDPMAIRKEEIRSAITKSKIERTGLTESYCNDCEKTLPISHFTIKPTGIKNKKFNKPRKNTPPTAHMPLRQCNTCLMERRKNSGQYDKDREKKKKRYRTNEASRKTLREAAIRSRDLLSDSYIKKLLKAKGCTSEQIKNNPNLIKDKRQEIKDRRESAAKQTYATRVKTGYYSKKDREELRPGYLRILIKNSKDYKGENITEEMLAKKKAEVLYERATGAKVWVIRKTSEQRKETIKKTSDKRTKDLDDVYIKGLIVNSTGCKREDITPQMIEERRAQIKAFRERKENGIKCKPRSEQLTRAYVEKIISVIRGIPRNEVTDEEIAKKRIEILAKRNKKIQKQIDKENRAKLKALRAKEKKEAEELEYKGILAEVAEMRRRKKARLETKQVKAKIRQEKKEAREAKIQAKHETAAALLLKRKLLEASEKHKELIKQKELQEQREQERLERKEAKKKARAAAKKVKRLAKKANIPKSTPVYNFFTPYELRQEKTTGS